MGVGSNSFRRVSDRKRGVARPIVGRRTRAWSKTLGGWARGVEHTYREVKLDFTPETGVFYMLFERCHSEKNRKRSLKQDMKYFDFRSKIPRCINFKWFLKSNKTY